MCLLQWWGSHWLPYTPLWWRLSSGIAQRAEVLIILQISSVSVLSLLLIVPYGALRSSLWEHFKSITPTAGVCYFSILSVICGIWKCMFRLVGHLLLLRKIKMHVDHRCLWFFHSWSTTMLESQKWLKSEWYCWQLDQSWLLSHQQCFPFIFDEKPRVWFSRDGCQQLSPHATPTPEGGPSPTLCSLHPHHTVAANRRNPHTLTSHQSPPTLLPGHHTTLAVLDLVWMLFLFFLFLSLFIIIIWVYFYITTVSTLTTLDGFLEFCSTLVQITKVNHWPHNHFSIPY